MILFLGKVKKYSELEERADSNNQQSNFQYAVGAKNSHAKVLF